MKCDAKLFAQMYEGIYADLFRFALCMMRNRQEAEDVVSEAVMAAYENIGKLRDERAFKSWVFTILSNICKKRLKKAAKEQEHSREDALLREPAREADMGLAIDVRKAFFLLEEEEQMIVGLSVFGGYNSQEIGKALKLNANTVRSKRSRALRKMECVLR